MQISWTEINDIAQIIGTLVVVFSLGLVIRQIKISNYQSKIAIKNNQLTAFVHIRDSMNSFSSLIAESAELSKIIIDGRQSYFDLSPIDKNRFERLNSIFFNHLETWYILIDEIDLYNNFKESQLAVMEEVIKTFFGHKGVMDFWLVCRRRYSPRLNDLIIKYMTDKKVNDLL